MYYSIRAGKTRSFCEKKFKKIEEKFVSLDFFRTFANPNGKQIRNRSLKYCKINFNLPV
jgi:hypothetical protein